LIHQHSSFFLCNAKNENLRRSRRFYQASGFMAKILILCIPSPRIRPARQESRRFDQRRGNRLTRRQQCRDGHAAFVVSAVNQYFFTAETAKHAENS
jgi:hypothetical protein